MNIDGLRPHELRDGVIADHTMHSGDLEILREVYDSEINFSIACFWDAGFDVGLGLAPRFDEKTTVRTYQGLCCKWARMIC